MWGTPLGIVFTSIGFLGISYFLFTIYSLKKFAWIKFSNGYYLFEESCRISGLNSIYNQDDLLVFYPEKEKVIKMKAYAKATLDEYRPAKVSSEFNNDEIYWNADESGYSIMYKGKSLLDTSSEYRGEDLLVKSPGKFVSFLLKNYKSSKDGKLRTARLA